MPWISHFIIWINKIGCKLKFYFIEIEINLGEKTIFLTRNKFRIYFDIKPTKFKTRK